MAFYSGFFNSKGLDRTYTAEDFTSYLSSIICNGILDTYGQNFKLTPASSGLGVVLGTGKAWINGHYFINDARYSIDLSEYMDESLPRYIGIAIYLDTTESVRSVTLKLFPGTPAENPSLPTIPQDAEHVRLLMYAVRLNPGATSLTERDWYDYREDANVCGYCKCILGKCKVTDLMAQMGRSKHSKTGRLSSKAGWVGLAKKFCILLMVVVAVRMDIMIGTTYIRDATCIGFCVNELLSIIENTSLMGIPYPPAIKKAIEVLQKRAAHIDDEIQEMIDNMEDDKK